MGFMEGLLGGFLDRKGEVEKQNIHAGELASERERRVFETLASADDPEIRQLALAGLLDSANPRKKKSGLSGWIGETMASPHLDSIGRLMQTPTLQPVQEQHETLPSRQSTSGQPLPASTPAILEAPGGDAAPAGMAADSPVQPGGGPPAPTPTVVTQAPPTPYTIERMAMRPREAFLSPIDRYAKEQIAKNRADIEGDVTAYTSLGMSRDAALKQVMAERMRRNGTGASGFQHVQVELPDGSQRWGSFEASTGVYLDADALGAGQRIPLVGARPMAASRTMGGDRESIAREIYGRPASSLSPQQMEVVNKTVQTRSVDLAGDKARRTGDESNITKMTAPLTPDQAAQQSVPFGTSMADLSGITPITDDQRKRHDAAMALAPQISEIAGLIEKVFPPSSGLRGGLTASQVIAGKRIRRDPDLALLDQKLSLAVGNISRVLAAESGRLTEQDVQRAQKALLDMQGYTDTSETAYVKIQAVEDAIKRIAVDMKTPGEVLKDRQATPSATPGAPPAPATAAPAGGSTPAAPTAYKDSSGNWHIRYQ